MVLRTGCGETSFGCFISGHDQDENDGGILLIARKSKNAPGGRDDTRPSYPGLASVVMHVSSRPKLSATHDETGISTPWWER